MSITIEGIKFYSISETGKALHVTPPTVRAYIKKGRIKSQIIGRHIYITENNVKEFYNYINDMGTDKERYPELYKFAQELARDVIAKINERAPKIEPEAQYKQIHVLELLISELESIGQHYGY